MALFAHQRHFRELKCFFCFYSLFFCSLIINPALATANTHCLSSQQQLEKVKEWVKVDRIVDGDTIHLDDGRKVRLIGINTPEIGYQGKASQAFAQQARKALLRLLKGNSTVGLYYDIDKHDRYKRLLAYVILENGQNVEESLLKQGLAHSIVVPPNNQQIHCFRNIEESARKSRAGLWKLAENQLWAARNLSKKAKGYYLISGHISSYSESRKSIYLKLTNNLSVRIAKKDKPYFPGINFKSLPGKNVSLRGWVNHYKGRQSIHVRSLFDLTVNE
ncbi:MAG: thermonuclease family protein [gamma proteobacterium symbiont of Taylorina sp.]|nr:thermonuclease family protein [gamma proteobacterium symbiont of Taylorina sp.]